MSKSICAISTAPGIGGIAVARVSGNDAFVICDRVFVPYRKGMSVTNMPANSVHFGQIVNNGEVVDDVLVTKFVAPHSFTGENTIEISCHGSVYIQQEILKLLIANGCTMATPGEFTQRAFLNGKMDLSQAESVADLIASQSKASHRLAMNQMRGAFSQELMLLRDKLLTFTSLIELELDFADHEELEFADRSELHALAAEIEAKLHKLTDSFSVGNALKSGVPVAIVGATNAGKSTLLNALVGEERAIVSDIHGTTRDVIEDCVTLGGVQFRFIDTAGLRQTSDVIENLGIERSYEAAAKCSILIILIDSSQIEEFDYQSIENVLSKNTNSQKIIVLNKSDLVDETQKQAVLQRFSALDMPRLFISAKQKDGIDQLQQQLCAMVQLPEVGNNDVIVTNLRHYEALSHAHEAILRVIDGLNSGISGDFLAQDLRECLNFLGEITGQITTDEVLGNIFSHFCIGK